MILLLWLLLLSLSLRLDRLDRSCQERRVELCGLSLLLHLSRRRRRRRRESKLRSHWRNRRSGCPSSSLVGDGLAQC